MNKLLNPLINLNNINLSSSILTDRVDEAPIVGETLWCSHHMVDVQLVDWNGHGHPQALVSWTDEHGAHRQSIPKVYLNRYKS